MRGRRRAGNYSLDRAAAEEGREHIRERGVYREVVDVCVDARDAARHLAEADVRADVEAHQAERAGDDLRVLPYLPLDVARRELLVGHVELDVLLLYLANIFQNVEGYSRDDDRDDDRLRKVARYEPDGERGDHRDAARVLLRIEKVYRKIGEHDADARHHRRYDRRADQLNYLFVEAEQRRYEHEDAAPENRAETLAARLRDFTRDRYRLRLERNRRHRVEGEGARRAHKKRKRRREGREAEREREKPLRNAVQHHRHRGEQVCHIRIH